MAWPGWLWRKTNHAMACPADSGEIKIMPWLGPAGLAKKNMPWLQSQAGIIHIAYDFSEPAVLGPLRACPKNNAGEK